MRLGQPLTDADVVGLQDALALAGIGNEETFAATAERADSVALFIRSLVGLDRSAAKDALADFLDDGRYGRNQIEFINYLTEYGVVEPSPYSTHPSPRGTGRTGGMSSEDWRLAPFEGGYRFDDVDHL